MAAEMAAIRAGLAASTVADDRGAATAAAAVAAAGVVNPSRLAISLTARTAEIDDAIADAITVMTIVTASNPTGYPRNVMEFNSFISFSALDSCSPILD
jgi:Na+/alanine symporter